LSIWFVVPVSPWLTRGADLSHGLDAGVFTFNRDPGGVAAWSSFRVDYTMLNKR